MKESQLNLLSILNKIEGWLRFAETKNGAILVFNCAIVFGIFQIFSDFPNLTMFVTCYLGMALVLLMVAIVVSLYSFIARLNPPWWSKFPEADRNSNILFFGHICSLTENEFLERFMEVRGESEEPSEEDRQLANQIVTNAKIAHLKFSQFNISAWFTVAALATPIVAIYMYYLRD